MGNFFWDRTNQPTLSGCIYGDISQRIQGGSLRMQSCYMGLSTRKLWESPISSTGSFMFISFSLIGPIQIAILRLPFGGASHLTFLMFQHVSIVSIFQPERLFFFVCYSSGQQSFVSTSTTSQLHFGADKLTTSLL